MVIILPDHGTRYLGKVYNDEGMRNHGFLEDKSREGFAEGQGTYWFIEPKTTSKPQALTKAQLAKEIVHWDQTGSLV
jgi:cystathionine beta-synthase